MHPARKLFRKFLFVCLALSLTFLFTVSALRIHYKGKEIPEDMRNRIFHIDVAKHQVWAFFSDDKKDMEIAESLLQLGFFSNIYSRAGTKMISDKADDGYEPAIIRLAKLQKPPVQAP